MERAREFIRTYPDEALLEEIRRVAELVEDPVLTKESFAKHSGISGSTIAKRFGGWRSALKRAGVWEALSKRLDEMRLRELRGVAELVNKPVFLRSDFTKVTGRGARALSQRFGGWRSALERAGIGHMHSSEVLGARCSHSDKLLLEEVRRVAGIVEKPFLTTTDFRKHSSVGVNTLKSRFGSWRDVLERAGVGEMSLSLKPHARSYTDEMILDEVRRVAALVEEPWLTRKEFDKLSTMSGCNVVRRLGEWRSILERAGIGHMCFFEEVKGCVNRYSDEDLLVEVRRVAGLVNKPVLTGAEFNRHTHIRWQTFTERFGYDWRAVLKRAGLDHMHYEEITGIRRGISDEDLLAEVRRVAGLVNKPMLSKTEFHRHTHICRKTITERFGYDWRAVLERAGVGDKFCGYSDEELLEEVRRVALIIGKPVFTRDDFDAHSKVKASTISHRFRGG